LAYIGSIRTKGLSEILLESEHKWVVDQNLCSDPTQTREIATVGPSKERKAEMAEDRCLSR